MEPEGLDPSSFTEPFHESATCCKGLTVVPVTGRDENISVSRKKTVKIVLPGSSLDFSRSIKVASSNHTEM